MIPEILFLPKRQPQVMNCIDLADGSMTLEAGRVWEVYPQGGSGNAYRVVPSLVTQALKCLRGDVKKNLGDLLRDLVAFDESDGPFEDSPVREMLEAYQSDTLRQRLVEKLEGLQTTPEKGKAAKPEEHVIYGYKGKWLTDMPIFKPWYQSESERLEEGQRKAARNRDSSEGYCLRCRKWTRFSACSLPRIKGGVPGAGTAVNHLDCLSWGISAAEANHLCRDCAQTASDALLQMPTVPLTRMAKRGGRKIDPLRLSVFGIDCSLDGFVDEPVLRNLYSSTEGDIREAVGALWDIHQSRALHRGDLPANLGIVLWRKENSSIHILDYTFASETAFVNAWKDFITKFDGVPFQHLIGASHRRTREDKSVAPSSVVRRWVQRVTRGTPISAHEVRNILNSWRTCTLRDKLRPFPKAQEIIMDNAANFDAQHPAALVGALLSEISYLVWASTKRADGDPNSAERTYRRRMLGLCLRNPHRAVRNMFLKKANIEGSSSAKMGPKDFARFEAIKLALPLDQPTGRLLDLPTGRLTDNDQILFYKGDAAQTYKRKQAMASKPNTNNKPKDTTPKEGSVEEQTPTEQGRSLDNEEEFTR